VTSFNRKAGDRRLADMSDEPMGTLVWEPDLPKLYTFEEEFPVSETATYRVRMDFDQRDKIVEWAVIQLKRRGDRWTRVAVYDMCHGKGVHVHRYDSCEDEFAEESVFNVTSYEDVEAGLDYAILRVSESTADNEGRSDRGH
jgi:hypothetical protein